MIEHRRRNMENMREEFERLSQMKTPELLDDMAKVQRDGFVEGLLLIVAFMEAFGTEGLPVFLEKQGKTLDALPTRADEADVRAWVARGHCYFMPTKDDLDIPDYVEWFLDGEMLFIRFWLDSAEKTPERINVFAAMMDEAMKQEREKMQAGHPANWLLPE